MNLALLVILGAPLIGSLINGLRWQNPSVKVAGAIGITGCLLPFVSAVFLFYSLSHSLTLSFFEWFNLAALKVSVSFLLDPLSMMMLLIVTGVGLLIHIFSVYYMSHDARPAKYFSYLNLFVFSMLVLVLADNLFLMFLGWEAVGFCSYLLIGFWFKDSAKAGAGMKAFLVNRIGDIGFILGILLLFSQFVYLDYQNLTSVVAAGTFNISVVKWACLFLFIGAIGKSAQIPLFIWLPAAMAGPTPVSALIHAATMVTAGVYLIARLSFLFTLAPEVLTLISWTGVITAFGAGLIACAQSDIKKILAYSTISQLGYMFVALGVGAFTAGMFHLLTHAFFKALLFLAAGVIIHALKGEQNIYHMGALKKHLPRTWFCFLIGFLALIGLPPFSGFFSKDEILWSAFASHNIGVFSLGLITAFITAFYMTRLYVLVFHGQPRLKQRLSLHEGGLCSQIPLYVLAFFSLSAGVLGIPHLMGQLLPFLNFPHFLQTYLQPVVAQSDFHGSLVVEGGLMIVTSVIIIVLVCTTSFFYLKKPQVLALLKKKYLGVFNFLEEGLRVDTFCQSKFVEPILNISHDLWQGMDVRIIQGSIILIQNWLLSLKEIFTSLQSGKMQHYILFMVFGLTIFILAILIK